MKIVSPILLAVSMLTRVPLNMRAASDTDWRRVSAWFPLAGYIIGVICAAPVALLASADIAISAGMPDQAVLFAVIPSVLFVALSAWMTRMFHLDGFCDACDAFSSLAETPADRLKIMKDPHPGAAAVCAVAILLILKTSFIFLLIVRSVDSGGSVTEPMLIRTICALVAVPVAARFAMTLLAWLGKYPREAGTGRKVVEGANFAAVAIAAATLAPLAFFLPVSSLSATFAAAILAAAYWKLEADKLLGGVTGDILGACCETAECAIALALILTL